VARLTYSVKEAASALGISQANAYRAVGANELPHVRIGKRILIPKVALQSLLDQRNDRWDAMEPSFDPEGGLAERGDRRGRGPGAPERGCTVGVPSSGGG